MTLDQQWAVLPFSHKKIKDKYLVTNRFGSWAFLEEDELRKLRRIEIEEGNPLFKKLEQAKLIISTNNASTLIYEFGELNKNLFMGPTLIIVSLTSFCNFGCTYCHASSPVNKNVVMNKETAWKVIDFVFSSPNQDLVVEFQGGEPTSNWGILKFIIDTLRDENKREQKNIRISVTTNLSLLSEEKIDFFIKNNVSMCCSLDGPKVVHDKNRPYSDGEQGTYDDVTAKIALVKGKLKQAGKPYLLQALPTITKHSLAYPKEIVDEFLKWEIPVIHLRFLNYLGIAKQNWDSIGYTAEEFITFWKIAVDYMIELNKKGMKVQERMVGIMLRKIMLKKDPLYTELMSPCGAGRTQILLSESGEVYTCDEGRMTGNDIFKMGNIKTDSYEKIMNSPTLMFMAEASLMDLYIPNSVFLPWAGTCPVENYSAQSNVVPKIYSSRRYKIYQAQFTYLFEKLAEGGSINNIFLKWASKV